MVFKKIYPDRYEINKIIEVGCKQYNFIDILKDEPKVSKKLIYELLEKVEIERENRVYCYNTNDICNENKKLLLVLLDLIEEKIKFLKSIEKKDFQKNQFFELTKKQSDLVDKEVLRSILYQNVWTLFHSSKRREKENEG